MTTITYEELQTESIFTIDYSQISKNFKTIDSFIKNFSSFQRKLTDLEKSQKGTTLELSNFKISTSNTFSTMNEILDSRGSISKGGNKAAQEEMNEIKKSIKDLKLFVTESTREINTQFESKQKQTQLVYNRYDSKLAELCLNHDSDMLKIESLEAEIYSIKTKYTQKTQNQIMKAKIMEAKQQINQTKEELENMKQLLQKTGVEQFKETLDKLHQQLNDDMDSLKAKFKLKTDVSDTLKLQEMLLNMIKVSYENVAKRFANKNQTKKALIFLQKKMNGIVQSMFADDGQKEGLVATKGFKCISCTKDFGQYEGKLEQFKAWSVFPAKQPNKQKYSGFGLGYQSIIETAVAKKGGEIGYDDKGRMTTPFNLSRENPGSLKHPQSHSQAKIQIQTKNSPVKTPIQSNYMSLFGRSSEVDLDIYAEYLQNEKGLATILRKDV